MIASVEMDVFYLWQTNFGKLFKTIFQVAVVRYELWFIVIEKCRRLN